MTFNDLVDHALTHGIEATHAPRTRSSVASSCGISRAYLYSLLDQRHTPRPHIRERIARGLADLTGMARTKVRRHLDEEWAL